MSTKFHITAVEGSGEESSDWDFTEIINITIDDDGDLWIQTTDDSTCTYLNGEWSSLSIVR